ncbi:MAG: aconitase X [Chloroflexi bacterium]|nr:aconitase X [Chloroflexota bacterium]
MSMELTIEERKMLAGEHGEPVKIAMKHLVKLGNFYDAKNMVDVGPGSR